MTRIVFHSIIGIVIAVHTSPNSFLIQVTDIILSAFGHSQSSCIQGIVQTIYFKC
jgi:hypothetical protein